VVVSVCGAFFKTTTLTAVGGRSPPGAAPPAFCAVSWSLQLARMAVHARMTEANLRLRRMKNPKIGRVEGQGGLRHGVPGYLVVKTLLHRQTRWQVMK
jgi:hypothetical protein